MRTSSTPLAHLATNIQYGSRVCFLVTERAAQLARTERLLQKQILSIVQRVNQSMRLLPRRSLATHELVFPFEVTHLCSNDCNMIVMFFWHVMYHSQLECRATQTRARPHKPITTRWFIYDRHGLQLNITKGDTSSDNNWFSKILQTRPPSLTMWCVLIVT